MPKKEGPAPPEAEVEEIHPSGRGAILVALGGDFEDTLIPEEVAALDADRLPMELQEHPGRTAWIATLASVAATRAKRLKRILKEAEAANYIEHRNGPTKRTEKEIESLFLLDPEAARLRDELDEAEALSDRLSSLADSMRHRRDCLVQLALLLRASGDDSTARL